MELGLLARPAWPVSAGRCCAGERGGVGDLPDAKVGLDEGLIANTLIAGIGRLVVVRFTVSAGVFLQDAPARGPPCRGPPRCGPRP
jgi:hypothetical protein